MKVGVKSIQLSDLEEVREEIEQLVWINQELKRQCPGVRIDSTDTIGHPMRMWEWGRVLLLMKEQFGYPFHRTQPLQVLDIGTAVSLIGPALCYLGCDVFETDVDASFKPERLRLKAFFDQEVTQLRVGNGNFDWVQMGFGRIDELAPKQYDLVMSISTIEHVETSLELGAWKEMVDRVKPGGTLIVTMDCFPVAKKGYRYDDVRYTNYDMELVRTRVDELKSYGMQVIGEEDYDYHGVFVDDGSFSWLSMVKPMLIGNPNGQPMTVKAVQEAMVKVADQELDPSTLTVETLVGNLDGEKSAEPLTEEQMRTSIEDAMDQDPLMRTHEDLGPRLPNTKIKPAKKGKRR